MANSTCPICGVKIVDGTIKTSLGLPISKKEFKAKVCIYAKYRGCINDYAEPVTPYLETIQDFLNNIDINPTEKLP